MIMNEQIKQIQDEIANAEATIKLAGDQKYQAQREAENQYWKTVSPINQKLDEVTEKYKDLAIDLAFDAKVAPYSRRGSQLEPTEVKATKEGMSLTWDADEHYNCVYHTVSWEDIFEAEQNNEQQN
jgi:hypothetical protein